MKKLILIILLSDFILNSYAQDGVNTQIIPPSPSAAALGKYGDIPVSLYIGVPNISIPIYTVVGNGISLPINLSYHASELKVEEIASSFISFNSRSCLILYSHKKSRFLDYATIKNVTHI